MAMIFPWGNHNATIVDPAGIHSKSQPTGKLSQGQICHFKLCHLMDYLGMNQTSKNSN
jgi:hypothetical protein